MTFYYLTGSIFFIQGQFSCTGSPVSCDPGTVGQTLGTTETGVVNGTFNPLPQIQTVITAGSYGGSASIAPATWVEIYGLNVGTTLLMYGPAPISTAVTRPPGWLGATSRWEASRRT